MWRTATPFEPTFLERLDHLFATGNGARRDRGDGRRVDELRRLAVPRLDGRPGPYMSYLCDEVVRFVDERYPDRAAPRPPRAHRQVVGRLRRDGGAGAAGPSVFGAMTSHCGDALFEACYGQEFPLAVRKLRDNFDGSYETVLRAARRGGSRRPRPLRRAARALRVRRRPLARPGRAGRGAAPGRDRDGPPDRRRVAAVARPQPGPDGAGATPRRCGR